MRQPESLHQACSAATVPGSRAAMPSRKWFAACPASTSASTTTMQPQHLCARPTTASALPLRAAHELRRLRAVDGPRCPAPASTDRASPARSHRPAHRYRTARRRSPAPCDRRCPVRSARRSRCDAVSRRSARRCDRPDRGRVVSIGPSSVGCTAPPEPRAGSDQSGGASRSRSNSPSRALKTSSQRPQRTQPSDTFSWSCTTRKTVPQAVQRVARLMAESCHRRLRRRAAPSSGSSRPRRR